MHWSGSMMCIYYGASLVHRALAVVCSSCLVCALSVLCVSSILSTTRKSALSCPSGALFSSLQKQKTFQDSLSHRILWHMHGALNIDKNKKLITQFACKSRDESFESSYSMIG